ncbi:MAG: hypothetical protein II995_01415 [Oscillospiraceae bacterium]|nr:hypothetical protein [Oscillospiraceae bacterium]
MQTKRKTKSQLKRQREEMEQQLTEELFNIAMGRDSTDGAVAIKDRLKAMEMLVEFKKGGEKAADVAAAQPVIIVDDITKEGGRIGKGGA